MDLEEIAIKIISLKDRDLNYREKLLQEGSLHDGYHPEMEKIHQLNAAELNEIIKLIGYPSEKKVGKEANQAAWLIVQHAISKPDFMKMYVQLIKNSLNKTKQEKLQLAYLTDRIACFEGKPQIYGTQFDWDKDGNLSPNYFEDSESVDKMRASVGLCSLKEQIEKMQSQAKKDSESPPQNFEERKKSYDKWRKKVGWF